MFKRILVPLDGSKEAEQPLMLAAAFARQTGGTVILLRVIDLATEYWPAMSGPYGIGPSVIDEEQAKANTYLHEVARVYLAGLSTMCITQFGAIASIIMATAKKEKADLILLRSHSYTGITRFIIGSEADKVARHTSIPTLIFHEQRLPEQEVGTVSHLALPFCLLVLLDGSQHAETSLESAQALLTTYAALGRKTRLHLLRVVPFPVSRRGEDTEDEYQAEFVEAKHYLQRLAQQMQDGERVKELTRVGTAITWSVAVGKDVAQTIVRVAEGSEDVAGAGVFGGCDMIALSTHGKGALQRLIMGSVAEYVLHLSKRPILVTHPPAVMDTHHPPSHPFATPTTSS